MHSVISMDRVNCEIQTVDVFAERHDADEYVTEWAEEEGYQRISADRYDHPTKGSLLVYQCFDHIGW